MAHLLDSEMRSALSSVHFRFGTDIQVIHHIWSSFTVTAASGRSVTHYKLYRAEAVTFRPSMKIALQALSRPANLCASSCVSLEVFGYVNCAYAWSRFSQQGFPNTMGPMLSFEVLLAVRVSPGYTPVRLLTPSCSPLASRLGHRRGLKFSVSLLNSHFY